MMRSWRVARMRASATLMLIAPGGMALLEIEAAQGEALRALAQEFLLFQFQPFSQLLVVQFLLF
jgi:hypothetical protein